MIPAVGARQWVLIDQMLVSGSNFLIALILARSMGPSGFGVYALLTTVQQFSVGLSTSLLANPVGMALPHAEGTRDRQVLLGGGQALQMMIGLGFTVVTLLGGTAFCWLMPGTGIGIAEILALAVGVATLPLLEWYRKLLFINSAYRHVFVADACLYGILLPAVAAIAYTGLASVLWVLTLWVIGSLLAVAWGHHSNRLSPDWGLVREHVQKQWRASLEWVAATQIQWAGSQGVIFVAAPIVGIAGIGAYRSAVSLLGFTNAIGQMLDNTVSLRSAEHYAKGGETALRKYLLQTVSRSTMWIALILAPFAIFPGLVFEVVLGDAYAGYESILVVHTIYTVLLFAYRGLIYYQRAKLQGGTVVRGALVFAAASICVVAIASTAFGAIGIVLGLTIGMFCSVLYALSFGR